MPGIAAIWRSLKIWTEVWRPLVIQTEVWSHNVWAWMLEDPVEILDPVVGLPKNYALNPKGEEMGLGLAMSW